MVETSERQVRAGRDLEALVQQLGDDAVGPLDAFGRHFPSVVTVDLDQDGAPDVELSGVGMLTPSVSWTEEQEQKRISLRSARALAALKPCKDSLPGKRRENHLKSGLQASTGFTGAILDRSQPARAGITSQSCP